MQYQVPQFIEIEDKIFGPLTFKQFLYVGGGAALGFIIWTMIPTKIIAIIIGTPIVGFFMAAAFAQVNGRPFLMFIEGAVKYALSAKLYIWKKSPPKIEKNPEKIIQAPQVELPKLSQSKLREISWGLDVHERFGEK